MTHHPYHPHHPHRHHTRVVRLVARMRHTSPTIPTPLMVLVEPPLLLVQLLLLVVARPFQAVRLVAHLRGSVCIDIYPSSSNSSNRSRRMIPERSRHIAVPAYETSRHMNWHTYRVATRMDRPPPPSPARSWHRIAPAPPQLHPRPHRRMGSSHIHLNRSRLVQTVPLRRSPSHHHNSHTIHTPHDRVNISHQWIYHH